MATSDRVDPVAGAVAHFQRTMMMDVDQSAKAMKDAEILGELRRNPNALPYRCGAIMSRLAKADRETVAGKGDV